MEPIKTCRVCGNVVTRFIKRRNQWWDWCSNKCMGIDPEVLAKKQQTNIDRFGSHPMRSPQCREKIKASLMERFGVDNASRSEAVKSKMRDTFVKKYGVDNPSKNPGVVEKIKQKAIDRYRDCGEEILDRRRRTFLEKHGVTTNKHLHISPESLKLMKDVEWLEDQHHRQKKSLDQIAKELGISPTPLSYLLHDSGVTVTRHQISLIHREIESFIKSIYNGNVIENTREIISPQELDIYLPDIGLAIEVDGVFWHSEERGKHRWYHCEKTDRCEQQGIHLLHIYDTEWNDPAKRNIIESKLKHLLQQSQRIFARKCKIKPVSAQEASEFLDQNHIQGRCPSQIKAGLYYQDRLVALATVGKARFNRMYQWELLRYCNAAGITVTGGLSRLLRYFSKNHDITKLISYADRRWTPSFSQNLYRSSGFVTIGKSDPNYKYFQVNSNKIELLSRNRFQKHMLKERVEYYDSALTEYENMLINGYHRIWDCGNLVYEWNDNDRAA